VIENYLKLYKSLNSYKVKYLVIGGVAVVTYGVPRSTLDLDIFIEATIPNAEKCLKALKKAGFKTASLTSVGGILANELTVFEDYIRLDLFTQVKGLTFKEAWRRRVRRKVKTVPVYLACFEDIIHSKKASGRTIDLEDLKALQAIRK